MLKENKNFKNIFGINISWLFLFFIIFLNFFNFTLEINYFLLSIYALFGNVYAVESLLICFIFKNLSSYFFSSQSYMYYLVLTFAIFSIFLHSKLSKLKNLFSSYYFLFTIIFAFFIFVHSIFISEYSIISIVKSSLWTVFSVSLLIVFHSLNSYEYLRLRTFSLWLCFLIILTNYLIYLNSNIGYLHDLRSFQGIFNHSQLFGIVLSIISSFITIILLGMEKFLLKKIILIVFLSICLFLIFVSTSRTALFSYFFSLLVFLFISIFFTKKNFFNSYQIFHIRNSYILKKFKKNVILIFSIILIFSFSFIFKKELFNFLKKNDDNYFNIFAAYLESRSIAFQPSLENIKNKTLMGIGFGLPNSLDELNSSSDKISNIYIGYHYEKGNIFVQVLEELGIIGLSIFILWFFFLIRRVIQSNNNVALIIIINIFFINLSEAVLFSLGGLGLLILILLFWSVSRPISYDN